MKPKRKRRPEIMKPSLKQLTPLEVKSVRKSMAEAKAMWASLLERNQWKPNA